MARTFFLIFFAGIAAVAAFPGCPNDSGVVENDNFCTFFVTGVSMKKTQALKYCREEYGNSTHLLSIENEKDNKKYAAKTVGATWLGLSRTSEGPQWKWDDGRDLKFTNWDKDEPNQNLSCAKFGVGFGSKAELWYATLCDRGNKIACNQPKENQWKKYNDYKYYAVFDTSNGVTNNGITWADARARCMSMGGDLASFNTHGQYNTINDWVKTYDKFSERKIWIGLTTSSYEEKPTWTWSDQSRTPLFYWNESYPIPGYEGAQCVYTVGHSGKWMNSNCGIKQYGFLCKRPEDSNGKAVTDAPVPSPTGYCPTGYFFVEGKCIKLFESEKATWLEALEKCRKEPGRNPNLVSITSKYMSTLVSSQLVQGSGDFWIGGYRLKQDGWGWVDGSEYGPFKYFESDSGPPCLSIGRPGVDLGRWSPDECDKKKGFICQTHKDPMQPIPTAEPWPLTCPADYTPYNKHCYKLIKQKMGWTDAYKVCTESKGSLATIENEAENIFIFSHILSLQDHDKLWMWIGMQDMKNTGDYEWIDGSTRNYTAWGRGQPKRAIMGGCVSMRESGDYNGLGIWEDKNCSATYIAMCRRPKAGPTSLSVRPSIDIAIIGATGLFALMLPQWQYRVRIEDYFNMG